MNDTFVYFASLPAGVDEIVVPCLDGFTVYIDENLSLDRQKKAYTHALEHIANGDFDYDNTASVHEVELKAHHIDVPKQKPIMSQTEIQRRISNLRKRHNKLMRECTKQRKRTELLRQIGIRPDSERL